MMNIGKRLEEHGDLIDACLERVEKYFLKMSFLDRHFLLCCFALASSFFWGGALVAIYSLQEVDRYLSTDSFLLLAASLLCVALSYGVVWMTGQRKRLSEVPLTNAGLYKLSSVIFILVSIPTLVTAAHRFFTQAGVDYLDMDSASPASQALMYTALYSYFCCLALAHKSYVSKKQFFVMFVIVMLPRLMIGSISGRFVAVMPVIAFLFVGLSRGYFRIQLRTFFVALLVGCYVLFVHPLIRAGEALGVDSETFMQVLLRSGPVNLMEQLDEVSMEFHQVNFLKTGLIGNIAPSLLTSNEREDLWKREGLAVTADRAFAIHEGAGFEEMFGPGSIYVGELYLIAGWFGVILGSIVLGSSMAFAQKQVARSSIWLIPVLDFAVKVPFVPRSNITYMYERVIPLIGLVLVLVVISSALVKISKSASNLIKNNKNQVSK